MHLFYTLSLRPNKISSLRRIDKWDCLIFSRNATFCNVVLSHKDKKLKKTVTDKWILQAQIIYLLIPTTTCCFLKNWIHKLHPGSWIIWHFFLSKIYPLDLLFPVTNRAKILLPFTNMSTWVFHKVHFFNPKKPSLLS